MKISAISTARWIESPKNLYPATTIFYRNFSFEKPIRKAILALSCLGVYHAQLNGQPVTESVLNPGFTAYQKRTQYQEYDVTALLQEKNCLSVGVGPGWAVGCMGWKDNKHVYGDRVALIGALALTFDDDSTTTLATDSTWQVRTDVVLHSDIYNGETVDLTAQIQALGSAVETEVNTILVPQQGEWIKEQERIAPVALIHTPKGETVIDFGQNTTGYVEIKIKAPRGARIVLHHAEVLDRDGNFYNENYRSAKNEMVYICSGCADVFKPRYSFQGFRYIKLASFPDMDVDLRCFSAIAVHSDMKRTGDFVCGNAKINQLYHNIVWGQKDNYLDIPTDCPQRDERLGWMGDAQVFFRTAAINYDVKKFFTKWIGDMMLEQYENGAVPRFIPMCLPFEPHYAAGWGDACCIIPWELYIAYGDKELLRSHFPMMKRWIEYIRGFGEEEFLWLGDYHYGDWLAMDGDPDVCVGATPTDFIASAFFAYSTAILVKAGEVLGEDMRAYRTLYQNVREAFRARYMKNGLPMLYKNGSTEVCDIEETETGYVLTLQFGLCDADEKQGVLDALVALIRKKGTVMTTGFLGTPYILHVLSDNGHTDLAFELLLQEKAPSWLYSVCHGATTMWEHWNSLKEDGSFWSTSMNSFNHYAYGAVYDWIFGVVLGIKPMASAPAYEEITLAPHPSAALEFARATYDTKYGTLLSHWYYKGDTVYYAFEIPQGVTAHLTLPDGTCETLAGGKYCFTTKV